VIRYGEVPVSLFRPTVHSEAYQLKKREWLIRAEDIAGARFLVKDGREIIIDKVGNGGEETVQLFVKASCMGALLMQRGIVPYHGSAVAINKKAAIFCGGIGSGKSTLTALLYSRGYPVIADDLCGVLTEMDRSPLLLPGPSVMKIWADSLDALGIKRSGLRRIHRGMDKYFFPVQGVRPHERFSARCMYLLNPSNVERPILRPLYGIEKLIEVQANLYKIRLQDTRKIWPGFLDLLAGFLRHVRVMLLTYPRNMMLLEELGDMVESDFCR